VALAILGVLVHQTEASPRASKRMRRAFLRVRSSRQIVLFLLFLPAAASSSFFQSFLTSPTNDHLRICLQLLLRSLTQPHTRQTSPTISLSSTNTSLGHHSQNSLSHGDVLRTCAHARRCHPSLRGLQDWSFAQSAAPTVRKGKTFDQVRISLCVGRA
jgi:hypothetical protein